MDDTEDGLISQFGPWYGLIENAGPSMDSPEAPQASSFFSRKVTSADIIAIWHLQATKGQARSSSIHSSPAAEQQQKHGEVGEEGATQGLQTKAQSKSPVPQAGTKASGQDKKKRKSDKEQKPIPPALKKHPSAIGRHGGAPLGPLTHAAAAGGSTVETGSSGYEALAGSDGSQGPSHVDRGDPEEAVRDVLDVSTYGMGSDAAVALVLRTLTFCREYLLRPEVAACIVNFLGVQLKWLCQCGAPPCFSTTTGSPQAQEEEENKNTRDSSPRGHNEACCSRSSCSLKHMAYLPSHLKEESACLLQQLSGCDSLKQLHNGQGAGKDMGATWFEPSLAGSVSPAEVALLQQFLQHTLINHAHFFAAVLGNMPSSSSTLQKSGSAPKTLGQ